MIKLFILLLGGLFVSLDKKNWWLGSSFFYILIVLSFRVIPFVENINYKFRGIIVDFVGFRLFILSLFISILILMARGIIKKLNYFINYFLFRVYSLIFVLLICFTVRNLILFYFFFEVSLIPTLFIIIGWGFQLERVQAGIYFLFYTITASLPLLLNLIYLYNVVGCVSVETLVNLREGVKIYFILEYFIFLSIVMAFIVKLPIFLTHLWLPKAHVEAPVAGSIILAGVLLKLGGYGLIRVVPFIINKLIKYIYEFFRLGLLRMVYVGLICWRLNDLKALVAYSSVAHIGLILCGLLSIFHYGITGVLILIVRHGLSSSGLFCMVNIFYERFRSRSLYINKGVIILFPSLRFLFFILCAANISAPPSVNLLGEIFLLIRVVGFRFLVILIFALGSFFGAVFTLFIYSFRQHGKIFKLGDRFINVRINEFHVTLIHIIPLNILILNPRLFFC